MGKGCRAALARLRFSSTTSTAMITSSTIVITTDTTTTTGTATLVADKLLVSIVGPLAGGSVDGGVHIAGVAEGRMTGGGEGVEEGGREVDGGLGVSVMTGVSGEESVMINKMVISHKGSMYIPYSAKFLQHSIFKVLWKQFLQIKGLCVIIGNILQAYFYGFPG